MILALLPLTVALFRAVSSFEPDYYEIQNEMSLVQLRRIMLIAYDLDMYDDHLEFVYHGEDYRLRFHNRHLILSPGTQIFIEDCDDVCFYEEGGVIYVRCFRKNRETDYPLVQTGGLRIADFPADTDELSVADGDDLGGDRDYGSDL